mmetsp:Transcript_28098/g.82668  ORF Transcript_28098/g.82668 Transcript_28098/m.82668 type:complete len:286 (+) Transcript_28098:2446-3303(+)
MRHEMSRSRPHRRGVPLQPQPLLFSPRPEEGGARHPKDLLLRIGPHGERPGLRRLYGNQEQYSRRRRRRRMEAGMLLGEGEFRQHRGREYRIVRTLSAPERTDTHRTRPFERPEGSTTEQQGTVERCRREPQRRQRFTLRGGLGDGHTRKFSRPSPIGQFRHHENEDGGSRGPTSQFGRVSSQAAPEGGEGRFAPLVLVSRDGPIVRGIPPELHGARAGTDIAVRRERPRRTGGTFDAGRLDRREFRLRRYRGGAVGGTEGTGRGGGQEGHGAPTAAPPRVAEYH